MNRVNHAATDESVTLSLNFDTAWMAVVTLLRLTLGAWMIISGYSYWAPHFGLEPAFPQPLGTLPLSNQMLVTMIEVGLFDFVKTCELIGGLCLVFGVFVPFAVVLLLPISLIVFYNAIGLNLRTERLLDMSYFGVTCLYMNIIVAVGYIRYYIPMLTLRSNPGSIGDIARLHQIFKPHNEG